MVTLKRAVFDIECDGLLPQLSKMHCLVWQDVDTREVGRITDIDRVFPDFLDKYDVIIGHNICRFDIPALEKLTGRKVENTLIDTLGLSWYLNPTWLVHGLEAIGEMYGIPKPKIDDWENLSVEEYLHRCSEDVFITYSFFKDCEERLKGMYQDKWMRIVHYLTFKLTCAAKQEEYKWKLDLPLVEEWIEKLGVEIERTTDLLKGLMPPVPKWKTIKKPVKYFKLNGDKSVAALKWEKAIEDNPTAPIIDGELTYIDSYDEPNVGSSKQVKDWLFSLGWKPCTFEYKREEDGFREIPQVYIKNSGGELSPSVLALASKVEEIKEFEGLSILKHRLSILEGFAKAVDEDGYVQAEIGGFTNTLRFKHRAPLVNLPAASRPYGDIVRGALTCEADEILCGSDMSSLEDRTKQHYIYSYDPEYVEEMNTEGFDPHLTLARAACALSDEEIEGWKGGSLGEEEKARVGQIRHLYKTVNYSSVYGVGAPKLALTLDVPEKEAQKMLEAYWEKNWAVKALAEDLTTKEMDGILWLYNPVSEFWYSLRAEKDKFSTLNQGTGVFCFDSWVREIVNYDGGKYATLIAQFHDEVVGRYKASQKDEVESVFRECIDRVNEKLKLNVKLDISVDFGNKYSEIH